MRDHLHADRQAIRTDRPWFHPLMEERRHLIQRYATLAERPPEALEAWDAPSRPPESWNVAIEDRQLPGPHGAVPVRVYTPGGDGSHRQDAPAGAGVKATPLRGRPTGRALTPNPSHRRQSQRRGTAHHPEPR
jgi:hypothetical protein